MAETAKKKPRKSKITVRNCETVDNKEDEMKNAKATLNKLLPKMGASHPDIPSPEKRPIQVSVSVEVERDDDSSEYEEDIVSYPTLNKKKQALVKYCMLPDDIIRKEIEQIMESSTCLFDKIIETEIRNSWGRFPEPFQEDTHETLLNNAFRQYRHWQVQSKLRNGNVFVYKCYICMKGWWYLYPFKEHVKNHEYYSITIEPFNHECSIVAYQGTHTVMKAVPIDGICRNCLKPPLEHKFIKLDSTVKNCYKYNCIACGANFFTCEALFRHEGGCGGFQKILIENNSIIHENTVCQICDVNCLTIDRYEKHLTLYHSVRSCDPVFFYAPPKNCVKCGVKYHIYGMHMCPGKKESTVCTICYRKFQWKAQFDLHNTNNKDYKCRVCNEELKYKCMEVDHMLKHSHNYSLAYNCLLCVDNMLLLDLYSAKAHSNHWHNGRFDSKFRGYNCVIVPRALLKEHMQVFDLTQALPESKAEPKQSNETLEINKAEQQTPARVRILKNNKKPVTQNDVITRDNVRAYLSFNSCTEESLSNAGVTSQTNNQLYQILANGDSNSQDGKAKQPKTNSQCLFNEGIESHDGLAENIKTFTINKSIFNEDKQSNDFREKPSMNQSHRKRIVLNYSFLEGKQSNAEKPVETNDNGNSDEIITRFNAKQYLTKTIGNARRTSVIDHDYIETISENELDNNRTDFAISEQELMDATDVLDFIKKENLNEDALDERIRDNNSKTTNEKSNVPILPSNVPTLPSNVPILPSNVPILPSNVGILNSETTVATNYDLSNVEVKSEPMEEDHDDRLVIDERYAIDVSKIKSELDPEPLTNNVQSTSSSDENSIATDTANTKRDNFESTAKEVQQNIGTEKSKKCRRKITIVDIPNTVVENIINDHPNENSDYNTKVDNSITKQQNVIEIDISNIKKETVVKEEPIDEMDDDLVILNYGSFPVDEHTLFESNLNSTGLNSGEIVKFEPRINLNEMKIKTDKSGCGSKLENNENDEVISNVHEYEEDEEDSEIEERRVKKRKNVERQTNKIYKWKRCNFEGNHRDFKLHLQNCKFHKKYRKTRHKDAVFSLKQRIHKNPWNSYPCSRCRIKYSSIDKYILHFTKHGVIMPAATWYSCLICPMKLKTLIQLCDHFLHHVKMSFLKVCIIKSKNTTEEAVTTTSKTDGVFQCKHCKKEVLFIDFFNHFEKCYFVKQQMGQKVKKKQLLPVKRNVEGNVSNQGLSDGQDQLSPEALEIVIEQITGSNTDKLDKSLKSCCVCKRAFDRRTDGKRHLVEHLLKDAYTSHVTLGGLRCQICHELFYKADPYRAHMREHAYLPVYKCDICDKTFSDSSNFAKHKKVHNLAVATCDICKKKFRCMNHLRIHMEYHMKNQRSLTCEQCNREFFTQSHLKKHIKSSHLKQYPCVVCDVVFPTLKLKWEHLWEVHRLRDQVADCPVCDKSFRKMAHVRNHVRQEHGLHLKTLTIKLATEAKQRSGADQSNIHRILLSDVGRRFLDPYPPAQKPKSQLALQQDRFLRTKKPDNKVQQDISKETSKINTETTNRIEENIKASTSLLKGENVALTDNLNLKQENIIEAVRLQAKETKKPDNKVQQDIGIETLNKNTKTTDTKPTNRMEENIKASTSLLKRENVASTDNLNLKQENLIEAVRLQAKETKKPDNKVQQDIGIETLKKNTKTTNTKTTNTMEENIKAGTLLLRRENVATTDNLNLRHENVIEALRSKVKETKKPDIKVRQDIAKETLNKNTKTTDRMEENIKAGTSLLKRENVATTDNSNLRQENIIKADTAKIREETVIKEEPIDESDDDLVILYDGNLSVDELPMFKPNSSLSDSMSEEIGKELESNDIEIGRIKTFHAMRLENKEIYEENSEMYEENYESPNLDNYEEESEEEQIEPKKRVKCKIYKCKRCCNFEAKHREYRLHFKNCKLTKTGNKTRNTTRTYSSAKALQHWQCCPCSHCKKKYSSVERYLLHLTKYHGVPYGCCVVCHTQLESLPKLAGHFTYHVMKSLIKLNIIKETQTVEDTVTVTSKKDGLYQCKLCKDLVMLKDFFIHYENQHIELQDMKKKDSLLPVTPEVKEKNLRAFVDSDILSEEVAKIVIDKITGVDPSIERGPRTCFICKHTFARRNDFQRHLLEHLLKDAYASHDRLGGLRCQICHELFNGAYVFRTHLREHADLVVYKCELCDKTFSDSSNFSKHKKVHNLAVLTCDICKSKFHLKNQIRKHMKIHLTPKIVKCEECDREFYTERQHKRHFRSVHMEKRYRCLVCNMTFPTLRLKWNHLWEVHRLRDQVADCPLCDKSFRRMLDARRHISQEHKLHVSGLAVRQATSAKRLGMDHGDVKYILKLGQRRNVVRSQRR